LLFKKSYWVGFTSKYRNILTKVVREAKRLYFQKSFETNKGNCKETWKLLREALNTRKTSNCIPSCFIDDANTVYSREHVASGFNNFFTSIGQQLENDIPTSDSSPMEYLKPIEYPEFSTSLSTNPLQIESIIKSLNPV